MARLRLEIMDETRRRVDVLTSEDNFKSISPWFTALVNRLWDERKVLDELGR